MPANVPAPRIAAHGPQIAAHAPELDGSPDLGPGRLQASRDSPPACRGTATSGT